MRKSALDLSHMSLLALLMIAVDSLCIPHNICAAPLTKPDNLRVPEHQADLPNPDWWNQELKRRQQQSYLENWQHDRESDRYKLAMMSARSCEFTAGKYAYWQARKILQSKPADTSQTINIATSPESSSPPTFFVSRNGPTDGTADGKSWKTAWTEFDQIDWHAILIANNHNKNGSVYAGAAFNEPINVVIEIDGGPANSFMTYYTPLKLQPMCDNPYKCHPLIRVANDPANVAQHGGQVILDGSKDTSGSPGIDAGYADGWYIWGSDGYGKNWPNQNGKAEPGFAVVNWPVGVYVSGLNYLWLDGLLINGCGVGVLAAALQDLPNLNIAKKYLNISPAKPVGSSPDGTKLAFYAGEGLHLHNCWIKDSNDMNYRANLWIANSAPGPRSDSLFPYGCPSLDGGCIVSVDRPDLVGKVDGIVYNDAHDPGIFHWYVVRGSVIGPGLRNGLVLNQNGGDLFVHGTLFCNPYKANVVKLLDGVEDALYVANCASKITSNTDECAPDFLNLVQSAYDKIIYASIDGGNINVPGNRVIGFMVHQINTTGNTSVLASTMIHNHSKSIKRAVSYFAPKGDRHLDPPASAAALAGLAPDTPLGDGFAPGYCGH